MPRSKGKSNASSGGAGKLVSYVLKRGAIFLVIYVLVLFMLAGTIHYWQGWALLAAFVLPTFVIGMVLLKVEREVLNDLIIARERGAGTASVPTIAYVMGITVLSAAGLSYRGSFLMVSGFVSFFGLLLSLVSFGVLFEAVREDSIRSTILSNIGAKVMEGAGLHGKVRHPIHFAVYILLLSMGVALGSVAAFLVALVYPLLVAPGIISAERRLERELEGFEYYKTKVKYRMIPLIW